MNKTKFKVGQKYRFVEDFISQYYIYGKCSFEEWNKPGSINDKWLNYNNQTIEIIEMVMRRGQPYMVYYIASLGITDADNEYTLKDLQLINANYNKYWAKLNE